MPEPWIIASKLAPPAPPPGWVPRVLAADAPVLVLAAGAGYGKTLGLLSLALADERAGIPVVWYTLDSFDTEVATFFHHLVAGVKKHVPAFGDELAAALQGAAGDPRRLWQRFFQAIASYNMPALTLVLDDVHHLLDAPDGPGPALAYFFDKLPPGVRLLLASRGRPALPLSRLEAAGAVQVLGPEALRFGLDEQEAFLAQRAEGPVPEAWRERAATLEGWPLGLDLATRNADVSAARDDEARLVAFVAEEMVGTQPPERQAFMRLAALLEEPTAEACRAVFGAADAASHLEALADEHLAQRLVDGVTYRFPRFLRSALQQAAERVHTAEARSSWHRAAAGYYRGQHQEERALPHLVAAKDWEAASSACARAFPAMRYSGRHALIPRWLEAFPGPVAEADPTLLLWAGHVASRHGSLDQAAIAYERARLGFQERRETAGAFKALVRQCFVLLYQRELKQAGQAMLQAMVRREEGEDEDVADLYLAQALAADQRGDLALVAEYNQAVLAVPVGDNPEIAASHCMAAINLCTWSLHHGAIAEAARHAATATQTAEAWGFAPYRLTGRLLAAHLHLLTGRASEAHAILGALGPHWEDALDWHVGGIAHAVIGHDHQARGDWEAAREAFERSLAIFSEAGYELGRRVPLERLMWLAVQRQAPAEVPALLEKAGELDESRIYDLALLLPHARALDLTGDAAGALATLDRAIPALAHMSARLHLTRARLFEAAAASRLGDRQRGEAALRQATAAIAAEGYGFLREQDQQLWEDLAALNEEAPTRRGLEIRALGGFEVRVGGVLVDQWPRRKVAVVLAALLLHPRGLGPDDLAEVLGASELTSATTWQADVSLLRRTLEPGLTRGQASRFIQLVGDRYVVSWEAVERFDLQAFERCLAEARGAREPDPSAAAAHYEAAIALYQGDLLSTAPFAKHFEAAREAHRQQAWEALRFLAEHHRARGEVAAEARALARAIAISPCEEEAYLMLMRHHLALGHVERARQAYWDCRKALKAELGDAPSPRFESAYRELLAGPEARLTAS